MDRMGDTYNIHVTGCIGGSDVHSDCGVDDGVVEKFWGTWVISRYGFVLVLYICKFIGLFVGDKILIFNCTFHDLRFDRSMLMSLPW